MTFDVAWPDYRVAIEVNGGQWSKGDMGHNSGTGVERDARKSNDALLLGWDLLVFVTDHIEKQMNSYVLPTIRQALLLRGAKIHNYDRLVKDLFEGAETLDEKS